jgi:ribonuclease G
VVKDPMGTKGARVTMQLSFAGRFLVFSPEGTGNGVSKRLEDAERERLRGLVKKLKPRNGGGLIVRTAARGAELPELERDLRLLEDQWEAIQAAAAAGRAPALVHQEVDLALEMVRDDLRVDVDEVVTDDPATFERITAYVQQHSPEMLDRVKLHRGATPLMRRYQVEEAIASTLHRRVDLPSGGYLLFDYAEAFTIVDVNTGRFVGKSRLEDTILKNNLEAATEVVRQLRLRDIGGMIIIDFIDMAAAKNRDAVIAAMQEELKKDRSKVYLVSVSPLGLVEMTRQNVTDGVREILTDTCPHCRGEGVVYGDETIALENLRSLTRHARLSTAEAFLVELHPRIAALMVGQGGRRLIELEASTGKHFSLVGAERVPVERCAVVREGTTAEILAEALPVTTEQELEVLIAEPHMYQAADAVARLDGGYRIVVAGAGPYLGETHRVRVERVGRLEAVATLLDATPVSEQEMLEMVDARTDIHEPERGVGERLDLEDRSRRRSSRKRGGERTKTVAPVAAGGGGGGGDDDDLDGAGSIDGADEVEIDDEAEDGAAGGARTRKRRKRRPRTGVAAELADAEVDRELVVEGEPDGGDGDDADEDDAEDGASGAARRRRRGRRGGRARRPGVDGAAGGTPDNVEVRPAGAGTDGAAADGRRRTPARTGQGADDRARARDRNPRGRDGASPATPRGGGDRPVDERSSGGRPAADRPAAGAAQAATPPVAPPARPRKAGLLDRLLGRG